MCSVWHVALIKPTVSTLLPVGPVYLHLSDILPVTLTGLWEFHQSTAKKPQFLIHTRTDANSHTHWIVAGCLRLLLKWLANHQELHRLLELYQSIVHHPWSSLPWWFGYSLRLYVWESVCFCVCLCVCDSGGIAWTGIKDRDVHSKAESDGNH